MALLRKRPVKLFLAARLIQMPVQRCVRFAMVRSGVGEHEFADPNSDPNPQEHAAAS